MELKEFKKSMDVIRYELQEGLMGFCGVSRGTRVDMNREYFLDDLEKWFKPNDYTPYWWGVPYSHIPLDRAENNPRLIAADLFELIAIEDKLYERY